MTEIKIGAVYEFGGERVTVGGVGAVYLRLDGDRVAYRDHFEATAKLVPEPAVGQAWKVANAYWRIVAVCQGSVMMRGGRVFGSDELRLCGEHVPEAPLSDAAFTVTEARKVADELTHDALSDVAPEWLELAKAGVRVTAIAPPKSAAEPLRPGNTVRVKCECGTDSRITWLGRGFRPQTFTCACGTRHDIAAYAAAHPESVTRAPTAPTAAPATAAQPSAHPDAAKAREGAVACPRCGGRRDRGNAMCWPCFEALRAEGRHSELRTWRTIDRKPHVCDACRNEPAPLRDCRGEGDVNAAATAESDALYRERIRAEAFDCSVCKSTLDEASGDALDAAGADHGVYRNGVTPASTRDSIRAANRAAVESALANPPKAVLGGGWRRSGESWEAYKRGLARLLKDANAREQPVEIDRYVAALTAGREGGR
jgi:hypothetical protein